MGTDTARLLFEVITSLFALRDNSLQGGMLYKSLFFLFFVEAEPALAILRIENLG
jgi:hypothetical protein